MFLAHLQDKPRKPFLGTGIPSGSLFKSKFSTVNPTDKELNTALLQMCCSAYAGADSDSCVHGRLSRAIVAQKNEGADFRHFFVTDQEANMVDKYGNSLLHVAARWGARVSLLLLILRHTDDAQMVNHRGETFLHVYHPPESPRMRPVSFLNLIRKLRSQGYDFCLRDVDKNTFLQHLVAKKEFPIETLYYVFREVGHGAARFLVANRSADGERLWHSIRKNLEQACPKLHRIFGDEVEFIRRYLPEFSDSRAPPSTADTSTCGSDSLISLHPADTSLDPNDSSAQAVRRTPLMKLLRRAAAGRGFTEKELSAKLESIFDAASKQEGFDLHAFLAQRDTEGNTALHYAAEFGIVTAVQVLCAKGCSVNVFNNCGNTPLQLVKYAIQRTDVRSDIHMEARYLRCAVLLLERGAFDQTKLVSERSMIFPYDVFDGSERSINNLVKQGVATPCRGLHLLTSSAKHHAPYFEGYEHSCHHQQGVHQSESMSMTFQTSVL
jgi:ankyrin repeat protein